MSKTTLVLGASENVQRYSNMAIRKLLQQGHEVKAIGNKEGEVKGITIMKGTPPLNDIDTVTLYLNAKNQQPYYDYIISLKPKRVIFNPGAENAEFEVLLKQHHIPYEESCTLVLLSIDEY